MATLLLSCSGNKNRKLPSAFETDWGEKHQVEQADTLGQEEDEKEQTVEEPATSLPSDPASGTAAPSRQQHQEYDNMRGFDPASEDDMDDNGMSRYMENNDDEGWD